MVRATSLFGGLLDVAEEGVADEGCARYDSCRARKFQSFRDQENGFNMI